MSKVEQNIPINKGNYSMDTPEREALFEKYRGQGWEEEYKEYRANWTKYAKEKIVSDYPLLVDIELATICNLHCPMCYTITEEFACHVHRGVMDFELFKKIIDEIAGKVPAIRLSLRGEPTLNPNFIKCIHYAKQAGIKEVSSLTNGSTLTPEFMEKMMLAGLDWLTVSIDGINEEYEKVRVPLKFADTVEKLKTFKEIKEKYEVHRPVIKAQGIWPSVKPHVEEYYHTLAPITDLVAFNPLIDYLDNDTEIVYDEDFGCPQLYQRLVIGEDGKVMACSNDENGRMCMGDVKTQSIHEIWHGEALTKMREAHSKMGGFKDLELCKLCYLPRKTEDNETSSVDGREFIIRNYVGRTQEIGK